MAEELKKGLYSPINVGGNSLNGQVRSLPVFCSLPLRGKEGVCLCRAVSGLTIRVNPDEAIHAKGKLHYSANCEFDSRSHPMHLHLLQNPHDMISIFLIWLGAAVGLWRTVWRMTASSSPRQRAFPRSFVIAFVFAPTVLLGFLPFPFLASLALLCELVDPGGVGDDNVLISTVAFCVFWAASWAAFLAKARSQEAAKGVPEIKAEDARITTPANSARIGTISQSSGKSKRVAAWCILLVLVAGWGSVEWASPPVTYREGAWTLTGLQTVTVHRRAHQVREESARYPEQTQPTASLDLTVLVMELAMLALATGAALWGRVSAGRTTHETDDVIASRMLARCALVLHPAVLLLPFGHAGGDLLWGLQPLGMLMMVALWPNVFAVWIAWKLSDFSNAKAPPSRTRGAIVPGCLALLALLWITYLIIAVRANQHLLSGAILGAVAVILTLIAVLLRQPASSGTYGSGVQQMEHSLDQQ